MNPLIVQLLSKETLEQMHKELSEYVQDHARFLHEPQTDPTDRELLIREISDVLPSMTVIVRQINFLGTV
jgi:hypothetical protein